MSMTSMERTLTTIGHRQPDRVPLFLLLSMHGAKELGLSIREYFAKAEHVVEGQMRLLAKYRHDCLLAFFYAALETEAWGGEVIYREDGPPNAGEPIIRTAEAILDLQVPKVGASACLSKVLTTLQILKRKVGDSTPIIGVAISPFSLPIMQLGFSKYIEIIYRQPDLFQRLMTINQEFCVAWANAQLAAGATAICYFDPMASPTIVPREIYLKTGLEVAKRTLGRINGPQAVHLASGRCLPIVDDIVRTGAAVVGVSVEEDLEQIKAACKGKICVLGNLNGITMCRWTNQEAERKVKDAIRKAAPQGGFILADNHGEIPFQVADETLMTISEAVHRWGHYPLSWVS